jgi:hypothetical protein
MGVAMTTTIRSDGAGGGASRANRVGLSRTGRQFGNTPKDQTPERHPTGKKRPPTQSTVAARLSIVCHGEKITNLSGHGQGSYASCVLPIHIRSEKGE